MKTINENDKPLGLLSQSEKLIQEYSFKDTSTSQQNASLCTQQKLELSSWGLPEEIFQFYREKGITKMFHWQLECLTLGRVLDAGNLVYSAPTSAGKTLVAEILMSKCIFERKKKSLVILPFVSVVREKMFYFQEMFAASGIHVEGYMGGHSPSINFKQVHVAVCTIEKANSIINRLLEEQNLHDLGLVVVDELHLLGDQYRGYLLELLLTKLKFVCSKMSLKVQVVGMSATLPNLKCLADWLNADLYYTSFRPVPLQEKVKCGVEIFDKNFIKISQIPPLLTEAFDDSEHVGQLCLETVKRGHSVLIFCPTKIWCENLAQKISLFFKKIGCSAFAEIEGSPGWVLRKQLDLKKISEVIEHLKMSPVGLDKDLHTAVAYGVGFHHAGLTLDERDIIEGSFRKGSIRVLCATSTLSSGVNLPARRVIIRSPMSFGGVMDVLTYHQMIGRAGRMGVDSEGESILICKPNEKSICQTLMCSNLKPIESCLGHGRLSASLKRALLEVIASGLADSPQEVKSYANCTFLAFSSRHDIEDPIQSCLEFLEENEFIRLQENGSIYVATPLAKACLASSLPPDEGLALFKELQRARRCFVLDTDLHIIYQVTPYSVSEQWSKMDWLNVLNILEGLPVSMKRVGEMVGVEESFLVRIVKGSINPHAPEFRNKLAIHRRFYTSLALQDLVNEMPLSKVAEKYECNKGMLQSLQQSAATYAGMVTEFTKRLGWGSVELIFSEFQERLQFGIQRELCELMRLPLLNAIRARTLYNSGFTSLSTIANANVTDLENIFLSMVPFQSKKEIDGETTYERDQRNKMETIWITGKADLSVRQAVELLIKESRSILELELGVENAQWGKKESCVLNITQSDRKSLHTPKVRTSEPTDFVLNKTQSDKKSLHMPKVRTSEPTDFVLNKTQSDKKSLHMPKVRTSEPTDFSKNHGNETKKNMAVNVPVVVSNENDCDTNSINKIVENNVRTTDKINVQSLKFKETNLKNGIPETESESESDEEQETEVCRIKNFHSSLQSNEIDYFASSFNFDLVPDLESVERNKPEIVSKIDLGSSDSDSNSSVEILYESTIHNVSKNLSISRISEDMFDMCKKGNDNRKKMSTPIGNKKTRESDFDSSRLGDTRSPDLFSQSLTFDTQMGRILDFEEQPIEPPPIVINPSSSFNSDDLGFVSDLSPPKPKFSQVDQKEKAQDLEIAVVKEFKSPKPKTIDTSKRKESCTDSPDLIFDESVSESHNVQKKRKYSELEENSVFSPEQSKGKDSDDEIMATPKPEKSISTNISRIRRLTSISLRKSNDVEFKVENLENVNGQKQICKCENLKWNHINVIDVSESHEEFKMFSERLREEMTISLALGCRLKNKDTKNIIGMRISKRRKTNECVKEQFCHNQIVLDGVSFYWEGNNVYYLPLNELSGFLSESIDLLKSVKDKVCRIFDTKEQIKMLQRCCSFTFNCSYQDPKIGNWLLSETLKEKNFSAITLEYLPMCKNLVSGVGSIVGYSSPGLLVKSNVSAKIRACFEAFLTFHVICKQLPLLRDKGLLNSFEKIEMPVLVCLAELELNGFKICRETLLKTMSEIEKSKEKLEEMAYDIAQFKFSLSSSVALSKVLFNVLNLKEDKVALTKKRKIPSINKEFLEEIAKETKHIFPRLILQWRKVRTILIKFVFPLLQVSSESTRVFGVSQGFTATGRISMHEPNLQNIPRNFTLSFGELSEDLCVSLRDIFVASENFILMSVDYCQIELRMLAHLSEDEVLMKDIRDSSDIFVNVAANIYNIFEHEVDNDLRQRAKQTCYGIIYGVGPRTLSHQLEISESDAEQLMEGFKTKYKECIIALNALSDHNDLHLLWIPGHCGVEGNEIESASKLTGLEPALGIAKCMTREAILKWTKNVHRLLWLRQGGCRFGVAVYLNEVVDECKKKGYVSSLMGRRRYLPAIRDPNQGIRMEAERQAINTTIQGSAADLVKTAMILLRSRLHGTKTRFVLHLHDELIFEVGKEEVETVADIMKETLENAMNLLVPTPVKIKTGLSWGNLETYKKDY